MREYCGTAGDPFLVNISANSAQSQRAYQTERSCIVPPRTIR